MTIVIFGTLLNENLQAQEISSFNQDFENYHHKIQVLNSQNNIIAEFKTAIADTKQKQQYGLMNLKKLPQDHAMIFIFKQEKIVNMWMKNTLIDLDMIFIDKNNQITKIKNRAKQKSLAIISSQIKVDKVLEINAGLAKKLAIKIGDKLIIK